MKTFKMLAVFFSIGLTAVNAQDLKSAEVPLAIQDQFKADFKNATDVEWEKDFDTFKVEFEIERLDHEVWYSSTAKQVKLEKEILITDLPKVVKKAIDQKFSDYDIDDCELLVEQGKTTYLIELEKWFDDIEVTYTPNGKLISTQD